MVKYQCHVAGGHQNQKSSDGPKAEGPVIEEQRAESRKILRIVGAGDGRPNAMQ